MRHHVGRHPITLLLFAALALAACEGATDPTPPPPAILEVSIDVSEGPIFRTLQLRLERAAAVEVEYWTAGSDRLQVVASPASEHAIFLPRLRAGSTYDYQVQVVAEDSRRGEPRTGRFTTDALPAALAELRFMATGTPTTPLVLLVISGEPGTSAYSGYVITDAAGEVVWYLEASGPFGITRRTNGNFVFVADRGLVEISPARRVVAEVPSDSAGRRFHHDVIATAGNTLLAIATDTQTVGNRRITGEAIWEWRPESGELRKRWSAFDFLDPLANWGLRSTDENWIHANSLWIGPRGNVLLSSNFLDQIISIAPDFQALEWRLGGPNATITVPEAELFSGQHTAAELEPGRILFFDNRREQGGYSRAVEFALEGTEARKVWEWRPARDNFARFVSSARRQATGTTLVTFGMRAGLVGSTGPIELYEVSREGAVLWHLEVQGTRIVYRGEPLSDIAGEVVLAGR